jgi:hypothetical protein
MQANNTLNSLDSSNNQNINDFFMQEINSISPNKKNAVIQMLNSEGCETFVDYIEHLGLTQSTNMVVLSSLYHYYYDAEEMKNVKTVINLKELNQIKEIKSFLHTIFHILPPNSNIIGCFVDNEQNSAFELRKKVTVNQKKKILDAVENGIMSRVPFLNRMYSMMDAKTNNFMSRANVTSLMNSNGFKVLDLTELNGLIYFCAQRQHTGEN